ncbi:MAG: PAS domain-containing protein [Gammaproteobacteria bacterium]|nr:PAS domain-containing protein [Gammaproteobacteria bacterium]NIR84247.1 PAS domain-containing protein [Gammaproteobacteria bacterium]NIR89717.1 PAS domain-containing protein [Gammaproteobacteria bacterium]NIU05405.1 PAS domain-containing protein [Gammaproteobacteria bacterium]NIV52351.1 PAS domain-containing protein [Gammaproteobacteria bacterium]
MHLDSPIILNEVERAALPEQPWKPLHYFNLYRAAVAGLFTVLSSWRIAPGSLGLFDPDLFQGTALLYFLFSILSGLTIRHRHPPFDVQVVMQVFADIAAITVMMHASGGVVSGFGMLLIVAVAGGSILAPGRIAVLFAAVASLAVLAQQTYAYMGTHIPGPSYPHAGILGAAFFATATLAFVSATRIRESEALAAKRGIDLANLAHLSEHIIQRMQSGILAVDAEGRVRLINESARRLLGVGGQVTNRYLGSVLPDLAELLEGWRRERARSTYLFRSRDVQLEVMVSFAGLGRDAGEGVLMFLEDSSAMTQRAQQLKLASLGRLTASIAHEIRNPLAAISHAGQLLSESSGLSRGDRRLTGIIQDNSHRMNTVIENVLRLSRRKPAAPRTFLLEDWLEDFLDDYVESTSVARDRFRVQAAAADVRVRVDPSQLRQVVWNLCDNGFRHSDSGGLIELHAGIHPESGRPYLDVVDNGRGISAESTEHIFEPFFTTEPNGTGLGLYIARELCEGNQASLSHIPTEEGCRFRITFSDPRRKGKAVS